MRRSFHSIVSLRTRRFAAWCGPLSLLLVLLLLSGCGYQDWDAKLGNGYRVMTAGNPRVVLQHDSRVVEVLAANESIVAYGHDAHWIQLRVAEDASEERIPSGRLIPKPFVLIDATNGTFQRFATESELLQALPSDVGPMTWSQAVNPHTPRFVYAGVILAASMAVALIASLVAAAVLIRKRRAVPG